MDEFDDIFKDTDETVPNGTEPDLSGSDNPSDDAGSVGPEDASDGTNLGDAEVDARFLELVGNFADDEEVIATASALMEAEYVLTKAEETRAQFEALYNQLNEQRLYHEGEARRLAAEMAKMVADNREVVAETRESERKVKEAEKKHEIALQAVKYREQAAKTDEELDRISKSFHWSKGFYKDIDGEPTWFQIKEHQLQGAKFLTTSRRAILGDGMGLGKTLTAIAAADLAGSKRILIIAPADITMNFEKEIRLWAPHRTVLNIKGMTKADRTLALNSMATFMTDFIVIVNYEAWRKDFSLLKIFGDIGFDTVILDEAHTLKKLSGNAAEGIRDFVMANNVCPVCDNAPIMSVKGDATVKGANAFRQCEDCGYRAGAMFMALDERAQPLDYKIKHWMTKSVKNVWFMTGTPILNQPADIFPLLNIIDPHNFEFKNEFLRMFCEQDYNGRWGFMPGGEQRLMRRDLHGRFLARSYKDAGIELPEQRILVHSLEVRADNYPKQREVIDMLTEHASIVLDDGRAVKNMEMITLMLRQRQANVWPGGIEVKDPISGEIAFRVSEEITEAIKLDKAVDIILEARQSGERVVVFSQFSKALEELNIRLNGLTTDEVTDPIRSVLYVGGMSDARKNEINANFDAKIGEVPKWDVVCANYKSGGTGLNLTATTQTIILDQEWNPGKRDQAYARNHRIGQEHETMVHILEVQDSIDQWQDELMTGKEKMLSGFNGEATDMQASYLEALRKGTGR